MAYFDDNTGDPEWKEIATSGMSIIIMCIVDEVTKERKQHRTVAKARTSPPH